MTYPDRMTPELLREALREVLYGPSVTFGFSAGLFSDPETGLLRTAHAFTFPQAQQAAGPGRPAAAQVVVHLRQHLEHAAAQLSDPHALRPDEPDAWDAQRLTEASWRAELVALARAGQGLYDALFGALDAEALRVAHGAVLHAAYHTGALRFHLRNLQAEPAG